MSNRMTLVCSLALVAVAASSCGSSPPARYYTLEPTAISEGAPSASYGIAVGPVSIPASVDRPQLVIQVAPNRVVLEEFDRWAAPLDDTIARTVAGNLAQLLGTARATTARNANVDATYHVAIDVQRFDAIPGQTVLVEAVWFVRTTSGDTPSSGRTVARLPVEGDAYEQVAAAFSRALEQLSRDIAEAIRSAAGKQP